MATSAPYSPAVTRSPVSVARTLARALDPVLLARDIGITLDPWQAAVVRSRAKHIIMNASRQAGKSTTAGLLAVDEAVHRPPAKVLILAPTLRQSELLFDTVRGQLVALGVPIERVLTHAELSRYVAIRWAVGDERVVDCRSLRRIADAAMAGHGSALPGHRLMGLAHHPHVAHGRG